MWWLAGLTIVGGALGWSVSHPGALEQFLRPVLAAGGHAAVVHTAVGEGALVATTLGVTLAGLAVAWLIYVRRTLRGGFPALADLLRHQFYIEDLYAAVAVTPARALASAAAAGDRTVIDGVVTGVARCVGRVGQGFAHLETGYFRHYAAFVLIGALVILLYWVLR
jgi:NADH-quinone oxidoreductase subunit L